MSQAWRPAAAGRAGAHGPAEQRRSRQRPSRRRCCVAAIVTLPAMKFGAPAMWATSTVAVGAQRVDRDRDARADRPEDRIVLDVVTEHALAGRVASRRSAARVGRPTRRSASRWCAGHAPGARKSCSFATAVDVHCNVDRTGERRTRRHQASRQLRSAGRSAVAIAAMATKRERRAMPGILRYLPLPARRSAERLPPYRENRTYREPRPAWTPRGLPVRGGRRVGYFTP